MFLIPDACESQPYVLQLPDKGSFVDISFLKENSSQSSNFCLKWSFLSYNKMAKRNFQKFKPKLAYYVFHSRWWLDDVV